jgi:hypothetical protein
MALARASMPIILSAKSFVGSDQPLSLGDRVSINDVVGLDVHTRHSLARWITRSVLAVNGYS